VATVLVPQQSDPMRRKGEPGTELHLLPGFSKVLVSPKSERRDLAIAPLGYCTDD
jgi:hypothetical protein